MLKTDKVDGRYYGETVANGAVGIVTSNELFKIHELVLGGAYDLYGRGSVSNFLKGFNLLDMRFQIDGSLNVSEMTQALNMRNGSFTTTFTDPGRATVTYTYYALRQLPYTVLLDVSVNAKKDITIDVANLLSAPDAIRDVKNYFHQIDSRPHSLISLLTSTGKSPTGKLTMVASTTFLLPEPIDEQPALINESWGVNENSLKFSKKLKAGETYTFALAGSTLTSAQHEDPLNEAERLTVFAKLEGRERLLRFHNKAWDELWKSDIEIEGDPQSQQDVHSMLYHLYAFTREGSSLSPSPMGLSGLGYNGHVFWDTEFWMYPALLLLHPELGRSLLEYRYQRLDAAKRNAFGKGYKGAMYPWESAASGVEETPVWALSGPFEQHISACVAIAAWNYYCVSQDKDWLKEKGWPILSATADFWASRVERNGPGKYEINNVVAADEWAENVNNNAFTNAAAKANLKYATEAAKIIGVTPDPDWLVVANNIPILTFEDGVTREHETYNGEKIKQVDVNLLAYPLHEVTAPAAIKKDLEYYEPRVGNGPAMTHAIFSILYSRMGDGEKAFEVFKNGYKPNQLPPFGVLAETAGGTNPYFATGAGGLMQAMLNGFGGLEITSKGIIQLKSKLPAQWKSLKLTGIGVEKKTYLVK
ncbi:glycoside hydrolase family 65 protein [Chitinophaga sp.]|uniref:glycoside hydrolase family 65 protein n=1 Tax=Chitinophaga sp. TaxID=1869181 RepID=UPI0031DB9CC3